MKSNELETYLASRAVGSVESEGQFTLEAESALRRLSGHSLALKTDFLLKLVQAATLLGTGCIDFQFGRHEWTIRFPVEKIDGLLPERLASSLFQEDTSESRGLTHLQVALRAALGAGFAEIGWHIGTGYLKLGESIEVHQGKQLSGTITAEFRCRRPKQAWYRRFLGGDSTCPSSASAHKAVYRAGRFSQRRIRVDGRDIERGWNRVAPAMTESCWYRLLSPHCYLMEGYLNGEGLPKFSFEPGGSQTFVPTADRGVARWNGYLDSRDSRFEQLGTPDYMNTLLRFDDTDSGSETIRECGAAMSLSLDLVGPALVFFSLDGVVSAPKFVDLALPGLMCLVSGEGLTTDLTEFQVVENSDYHARIDALKKAAERFKETLLKHLPQLKAVKGPEVPVYRGTGRRTYASPDLITKVESTLISAF